MFVIKISGLEAESHIPGAVGEPLTCTGAPCGLIAFGPNARGVICISDSLLKFSGKFIIGLFGISLCFLPLGSFQYNRESLLGLFGDRRFKFKVVLANKIYLIFSLP